MLEAEKSRPAIFGTKVISDSASLFTIILLMITRIPAHYGKLEERFKSAKKRRIILLFSYLILIVSLSSLHMIKSFQIIFLISIFREFWLTGDEIRRATFFLIGDHTVILYKEHSPIHHALSSKGKKAVLKRLSSLFAECMFNGSLGRSVNNFFI